MFRVVQKFLHSSITQFYMFSLSEERVLKIVIKGLLFPETTATELNEDLNQRSMKSNSFINLKTSFVPIYMVSLPTNTHNEAIFSEYSLFFMSVKIKHYKNLNPALCFSFQRLWSLQFILRPRAQIRKIRRSMSRKKILQGQGGRSEIREIRRPHTANFK